MWCPDIILLHFPEFNTSKDIYTIMSTPLFEKTTSEGTPITISTETGLNENNGSSNHSNATDHTYIEILPSQTKGMSLYFMPVFDKLRFFTLSKPSVFFLRYFERLLKNGQVFFAIFPHGLSFLTIL